MIATRNDKTIRDMGQKSVAIGNKHFEVVKKFVYLGSLMTPTNDVSLEIEQKIQKENQMLVFERKVLRTICGPKIENGHCRRWFNPELH
jgi:hypothetical protein